MKIQQPEILSRDTTAASRFLELCNLTWRDARGRERHWDCASRTGGHGRAVYLIARLMPERALVLVRQFRPPAGKYCLEFPAGLVEPGEEFESAAVRELSEETGYAGKVVGAIPFGFSSAGLTDEVVAAVIIEINSQEYQGKRPQAHPEEDEDIEVILVPERELLAFLQQRIAEGDAADAKLLAYAYASGQ